MSLSALTWNRNIYSTTVCTSSVCPSTTKAMVSYDRLAPDVYLRLSNQSLRNENQSPHAERSPHVRTLKLRHRRQAGAPLRVVEEMLVAQHLRAAQKQRRVFRATTHRLRETSMTNLVKSSEVATKETLR